MMMMKMKMKQWLSRMTLLFCAKIGGGACANMWCVM